MARPSRNRSRARGDEQVESQEFEAPVEVGTGLEVTLITFTTLFLISAIVIIVMLTKDHYPADSLF